MEIDISETIRGICLLPSFAPSTVAGFTFSLRPADGALRLSSASN
jgi:hypothetical protein